MTEPIGMLVQLQSYWLTGWLITGYSPLDEVSRIFNIDVEQYRLRRDSEL